MRTLRVGLILALAALAAGCDAAGPSSIATDTSTPTPAATATRSPSPSAAASARPSAASSAAPSIAPSRAPTAAPTPAATAAPTPTSAPATSATACTGTAGNQQFFASTSAKVAWALYCPVLPSGWYVVTGSYTAANGGTMVITYRNNAGHRFELKEGAWCTGSAADCGPLDSTLGSGAFGDLTGVVGKRSSSFVLYVAPGQNPAWAATGTGIDEATFRSFAQGLRKVAK